MSAGKREQVVTVKTLARKAGVSPATVSLALNGDPRVAAKTRGKISRLAGKLKYVPNNFGRALQSSRSRLVGYVIQKITTSFFSEILQGMGECATEHGYGLLVAVTGSSREKDGEQLRLFREKRLDGLVVSGVHPATHDLLLDLNESGLPVVICSGVSFDKRIPYVVTDDFKGGVIAASHLLGLGHEKIAYYGGSPRASLRYQGVRAEFEKHGIKKVAACGNEQELRSVLQSPAGRPTAIVAYSDRLAIDAKHVIETSGLCVPGDISLLGYDNLWTDLLPEFNLTSIAPHKEEIGRISMLMLMELINGREVKPTLVEPRIYPRASTARRGGARKARA